MRAGPFTRAEAIAAEYSAAGIRRFLADGTWVVVRHGVYLPALVWIAVADDRERRHAVEVSALLLASGRDAVGAGSSAARILGLDLLGEPAAPVRAARRAWHHSPWRADPTAARTVVDLAREWPLVDAVVAADSALRTARTTLPELHAVLADCAGGQASNARPT